MTSCFLYTKNTTTATNLNILDWEWISKKLSQTWNIKMWNWERWRLAILLSPDVCLQIRMHIIHTNVKVILKYCFLTKNLKSSVLFHLPQSHGDNFFCWYFSLVFWCQQEIDSVYADRSQNMLIYCCYKSHRYLTFYS